MREEGSGTRKEAEEQLKAAGIPAEKLDVIASIGNQESIKKSVRQGMGITILSELAAVDEEADGELLTFPIPGADAGWDINLVYNKNYQLSRSAERLSLIHISPIMTAWACGRMRRSIPRKWIFQFL